MRRSVLAIALVILSMLSFGILIDLPDEASAYTPHDPILIWGDSDFTLTNGVVAGTGTPSDPFIIEGWIINATLGTGIYVKDTSAHFVIRNLLIHSDPPTHAGVHFENVRNGRIDHFTSLNNDDGIVLRFSSDVIIIGNNITGSDDTAIALYSSSRVSLTDNRLLRSGNYGLRVSDSDGVIVRGNNISNAGEGSFNGIHFISTVNSVVEDNIVNVGGYGISFMSCEEITISGNFVSGNWNGILFHDTKNAFITSNQVVSNRQDGIIVYGTSGEVMIVDNIISSSETWAINFLSGTNITILGNNISDNYYGVKLQSCANGTVTGNTISGNGYGIRLGWVSASRSTNVLVHHNSLIGNAINGFDIAGSENQWDDGYPSGGNYWSDYAGPDFCSGPFQDVCPDPDGLGDTPYMIDADSRDRYPLMTPPSSPPSALEATLTGADFENVHLTWTLSSDDGRGRESVIGYEIHRNTSYDPGGSDYQLVASLPNGTSEFVDISAGEGDPTDYFYRVCALDQDDRMACAPNQAGKFTRPLSAGPQLVSIPLVQPNESIETVLQTVKYDKAWYYDSASHEWKWYMKQKDYCRGLFDISNFIGIWIDVTENSNLTVAGIVPAQTVIHLYEGWNLVSFPSFNTSYTVYDLKTIGVMRTEGYDASSPYHLRVLGDAEALQAGYGYWVKVQADTGWMVEVL